MIINIIQLQVFLLLKLLSLFLCKRIHKEDNSLKAPTVIISNHLYYADPIAILGSFSISEALRVIPLRAIIANKYMYNRWYGWILRATGGFPSETTTKQKYGLNAIIEYSIENSLLIFPEGQRNPLNEQIRLRTGAAVLARRSEIPFLPFYICSNGRRIRKYKIVRGRQFNAEGMTIEQMMDKVWELEKLIK